MKIYKHFVLVAVVTEKFHKKKKIYTKNTKTKNRKKLSTRPTLYFSRVLLCVESEKKVVISFKCF